LLIFKLLQRVGIMRIFQAMTVLAILTGSLSPSVAAASTAASFALDAQVSISFVSAVSLRDGTPRFGNYGGIPWASNLPNLNSDVIYNGTLGYGFGSRGPMGGTDTSPDGVAIEGWGGSNIQYDYYYRSECADYYHSNFSGAGGDCAGDTVAMTFNYVLDVSASAAIPDFSAPHEASASIWASISISVKDLY
jgi:hypothetical protein